jgi:DNA-binding NarL/FixJ family response regulator
MNILHIDDHALFCEGLELVLRSIEPMATVRHVTEFPAALNLLAHDKTPDLILTDLQLPGVLGVEAVVRLRERCEGTPIVALSANEDPDLIQAAIDCGAMGYILKSASSIELASALAHILRGGVYLPMSARAGMANGGARVQALTPRQRQVLQAIIQGKSNKVIARELQIADPTVKTHVAAIFTTLNVHSRTQAVYAVARLGIELQDAQAPSAG